MGRPILRTWMVLLAALALLGAAPGFGADRPVNINTASAADLETLSGIGPAKAQAIVEHREKNGAFKNVDDLKLVRGIGDKLLEQLRPQVTVGEAPPPGSCAVGKTLTRIRAAPREPDGAPPPPSRHVPDRAPGERFAPPRLALTLTSEA